MVSASNYNLHVLVCRMVCRASANKLKVLEKTKRGEGWEKGMERDREERAGKGEQMENLACRFSRKYPLHGDATECLIMNTFTM